MRYTRRMSAPVPTTVRRSSPVSSVPSSFRRLSLADIPVPRSSRKLSLVECSTTTNGHSESSVEIDTSSLSYDLPATGPPYAGSYQPIPRVAASRHSPGLLTLITTNRSCYVEWSVHG
ncbi:hypothetical protein Cfor_12064 [Coptotermes formosanus]|uniref:Uncharacterized protein n=1 Tax=Coptotermes formosanus TaxID=36987 RepID=A0A6L2PQW2_COPFO|nr:hypothetical protein Cfor_12064 [Coptotermes formosanus]